MVLHSTYGMFAVQALGLVLFPLCSLCISLAPQNGPSLWHHNITVPSLGSLGINCYHQPPMPSRRLAKVGIHDCYVALQYLLRGEKTMAPIHFTEDDRKGFRIPHAWGHGSCQVIIQNLIPRAEETFSFALIAHLGAEVTEACVLDRPGSVGGEVKVGDRNLFQIIVAGTGNGGGTGNA